MKYEGMIYRPPSEANSLILQVAVGCSYNRCTFCHSFQEKSFRIKSFEEIKEDIDEAAGYGKIPRVFLADGDALIIPQPDLIKILSYLKQRIRGLERVGIYANAVDVLKKNVDELRELKKLGLGIVYLGLESGNPEVLKRIRKNATAEQMIRAAKRVKEAGILLSVTVLLGIGGVELSREHAEDTGKVLSQMDPEFVGALSLMIVPGTPIADEIESGKLVLPSPFALIRELGLMIAHCRFTECFFASNHASNYLPLRIRMPQEKEQALKIIREVLEKNDPSLLRPEYMRALQTGFRSPFHRYRYRSRNRFLLSIRSMRCRNPISIAQALKARSIAAQGASCAALSGLMNLLTDNPGLRMLRILRPGLLCPAPLVLAAPAIGTMSPQAAPALNGHGLYSHAPSMKRTASGGDRNGPLYDRALPHQGTASAALSGLMNLLTDNPGLRMLRILRPGLLCPAPLVLAAPAIGTMSPQAAPALNGHGLYSHAPSMKRTASGGDRNGPL